MNNETSLSKPQDVCRHEINNRLGTLALAIEILQHNSAPDVRDLAQKMETELETLQQLLRDVIINPAM